METLILLFIIFVFGFYSFPLYSYFALVGAYSFIFCDMGIIFWSIFLGPSSSIAISKSSKIYQSSILNDIESLLATKTTGAGDRAPPYCQSGGASPTDG